VTMFTVTFSYDRDDGGIVYRLLYKYFLQALIS